MVTTLAENEIFDSNWDFLDPTLRTRYSSVASKDIYKMNRGTVPRHCPASELQKYRPNCIPYFTFTYHPSSEKNVYVREYKTVLVILSDLGGIYDIIIMFFGFLYCWYNQRGLNKYLRRGILKKETKAFKEFFPENSDSEIKKFMEEVIEQRQSAMKLFRLMNSFEILENAIFAPHHQALIPLLLMKEV